LCSTFLSYFRKYVPLIVDCECKDRAKFLFSKIFRNFF